VGVVEFEGVFVSAMKTRLTFPEEGSVVRFAADMDLIAPAEVVAWAYKVIESMPKPPLWVIELATEPFRYFNDLKTWLHDHTAPLEARPQCEIIVALHMLGRGSLQVTLSRLFRVLLLDLTDARSEQRDEALIDALITWDYLNEIPVELEERFATIFESYPIDAAVLDFLRAQFALANPAHA
jgi:hypothetical protein